MSFEEVLEDGDGGTEVVAEGDQEVDVVDIQMAMEAMGQVVAGVDNGLHFMATGTDETEHAIAAFGQGAINAEGSDGDGQWQVVANAAE